MPKATKRKQEKQADFKKAKLKLGKGKQTPSNATDTSFKARSIALPNQHQLERALLEASANSQPTTSGGLTLDEVLIRLRHPNASVRKDTLGGVKDILIQAPQVSVSKVLRVLGVLITDDDGPVRKALLHLLEWYLPLLPLSTLSPHLAFFLVQLSSGLSSIFPEIRLDSCKIVHLLLSYAPSRVTAGWPAATSSDGEGTRGGNTILEGLRLAIGLIGEKGGATGQMGKLGSGARLVVLRTMLAFVQAAVGSATGGEVGEAGPSHKSQQPLDVLSKWVEGGLPRRSGKGKEIEVTLDGLIGDLRPFGAVSQAYSADTDDRGTELDFRQLPTTEDLAAILNRHSDDGHRISMQTGDPCSDLYLQLAPLLLSTFLEAVPSAFPPSSSTSLATSTEEISVSLCVTCASLTEVLLHAIAESSSSGTSSTASNVQVAALDFTRRMAPYFPFRASRAATTASGISPAFSLSLSYANLVTLLSGQPPAVDMTSKRGWRGRVQAIQEAWAKSQSDSVLGIAKGKKGRALNMDDISEWVSDVLHPHQDALTQPLVVDAYDALLPIVWSIMSRSSAPTSDTTSDELGIAFFQHLLRQGSSSAIRSLGDTFTILLVLLHEQPTASYPFYLSTSSPIRPLMSEWLVSIPKVLWELGNRRPDATERLVQFLLEIGRRGSDSFETPYSLIDRRILGEIAAKLPAYFMVTHPTKGELPGPWHRLADNRLKKLVLDMSQWWVDYDVSGQLQSVLGACSKPS